MARNRKIDSREVGAGHLVVHPSESGDGINVTGRVNFSLDVKLPVTEIEQMCLNPVQRNEKNKTVQTPENLAKIQKIQDKRKTLRITLQQAKERKKSAVDFLSILFARADAIRREINDKELEGKSIELKYTIEEISIFRAEMNNHGAKMTEIQDKIDRLSLCLTDPIEAEKLAKKEIQERLLNACQKIELPKIKEVDIEWKQWIGALDRHNNLEQMKDSRQKIEQESKKAQRDLKKAKKNLAANMESEKKNMEENMQKLEAMKNGILKIEENVIRDISQKEKLEQDLGEQTIEYDLLEELELVRDKEKSLGQEENTEIDVNIIKSRTDRTEESSENMNIEKPTNQKAGKLPSNERSRLTDLMHRQSDSRITSITTDPINKEISQQDAPHPQRGRSLEERTNRKRSTVPMIRCDSEGNTSNKSQVEKLEHQTKIQSQQSTTLGK